MQENVRKLQEQLEGKLQDSFKGQIDTLAVVKENMEMTEKLRESERRANVCSDRLKEYEEITKRLDEEGDRKEAIIKVLKAENESNKANLNFSEQ